MLEVATIYLDPLSKTHVYKLEVASLRNYTVFRLNISVDYTQVVKKVQGLHHTSNVNLAICSGKQVWSLSNVQSSPPRQISSNMCRFSWSWKVRYSLTMKLQSKDAWIAFSGNGTQKKEILDFSVLHLTSHAVPSVLSISQDCLGNCFQGKTSLRKNSGSHKIYPG